MYNGFYEEGDTCPECDEGILEYRRVEQCTCHISPPCSACVNKPLMCNKCDYEPEEPDYKDVPISIGTPSLYEREYKPKPLDNSKIDYRIKGHTSSSQICEGVYPNGTSMDDVRNIVNGSFGGRFEQFGNGTFKFIAYTD